MKKFFSIIIDLDGDSLHPEAWQTLFVGWNHACDHGSVVIDYLIRSDRPLHGLNVRHHTELHQLLLS